MSAIQLGSKLSFAETNQFVESVSTLLQQSPNQIHINMKECHYLNSIMLSGLIRALKMCQAQNCQLVLKQVNASARTLFETTNVLSLFSIEDLEVQSPTHTILELKYSLPKPNIGIFQLTGSLNDSEQCSQFRNLYEPAVLEIKHAVLDCAHLFHLGGAGVNEMFRLRGILYEKSGKLFLINPTDAVESVWKMMHLDSLIPYINHLDEISEPPL